MKCRHVESLFLRVASQCVRTVHAYWNEMDLPFICLFEYVFLAQSWNGAFITVRQHLRQKFPQDEDSDCSVTYGDFDAFSRTQ